MADSDRRVSGYITTRQDSGERVAYDLMQHIANATFKDGDHAKRDERYWLELYQRCHRATRGLAPE